MDNKPFKVLGVEHIGIASNNLDGINHIFSDIFGLDLIGREKVLDQKVITDIYNAIDTKLEFLKAIDSTSPISKFLENNKSVIHHIALKVDKLKEALEYLEKKGIVLIDKKPRIGAEGLSIAFIHPKSTGGILVELCESK